MSKFHSTVSRRTFMKGIGLTGAGLGAAAAVAPVFHDLDEVLASPSAEWKRPWWIKEREHDDPVAEVDWDMLQRYDHKNLKRTHTRYASSEERGRWSAAGKEVQERIGWNNYTYPGQRLRDRALGDAAFSFYRQPGLFWGDWGGPKTTQTPEERGVPKWTGTHEEATRMLRAAMLFFGAVSISPGELNGKHRKLINLSDRGHDIVFEDVADGYDDGTKHVLPANRELWEIGYQIPMSREAWNTAHGAIRSAANISRYHIRTMVAPRTQEFLHSLGYICEGATGYPVTSGTGSAILHGSAEPGRNNYFAISPEYGTINGYFELITDLPLEPGHPIDAGIFRFCHSCGRCAKYCPSGSISFDKETSWEPPSSPYAPDITGPGHLWKKIFWTNATTCQKYYTENGISCYRCFNVCTFNTGQGAIAHQLARATVSATSIFNGFLVNMAEVFDYGERDPEEWWDLTLPSLGFDSTLGPWSGGRSTGSTGRSLEWSAENPAPPGGKLV